MHPSYVPIHVELRVLQAEATERRIDEVGDGPDEWHEREDAMDPNVLAYRAKVAQ
jgi:hypothetical protein